MIPYDSLSIALLVSAAGKVIVNVPLDAVKSEPKAIIHTVFVVDDPPSVVVL